MSSAKRLPDGQNHTRLSDAEIAELKASADLVGLVRSKIELTKSGNGEWIGRCPFHAENTPSFYVIPKKHMFHCFGCSASGSVFDWLKRTEGLTFREATARLRGAMTPVRRFTSASMAAVQVHDEAADERRKIEKARQLWDESAPAQGTLVERYLASRGLGGLMIPATIRFHPQMWNVETNTLMPAMIAAVSDLRQQIVGIHRTFLSHDGRSKANIRSPKKMLGPCQGSHIHLGLPAFGKLAIAEGIETSLTIMQAMPQLTVWAAMSLNNMGAPVPNFVSELILCADSDSKDPKAAEAVLLSAVRKHRERSPGRIVRIARPTPGKDFNDMVREQDVHEHPYEAISNRFDDAAPCP
jgi:hypothetical protein